MNNRWGRQVEPKGQVRGPGQNYININFNFSSKDKPNTFHGKKIDNFIEINSDPKPHPSRPNISMETLKQKKKKSNAKQQLPPNTDLNRKKSKSRLNQAFTPQKKIQDRGIGESRSLTKKSTTKRNSKSTQNLKLFQRRRTPQSTSKSKSRQKSKQNSNQKFYSRSKSRSKSQSSKKLIKNYSKSRVVTNYPKTHTNNNSNKNNVKASSVAVVEQKPAIQNQNQKTKRSGTTTKMEIPSSSHTTHGNAFKKKTSPEKIARKKLSHDESRKNIKSNTIVNKKPRKKSKQKQKDRNQLQRNPLIHHEQQPDFDEESSYKKMNIEAHKLLYEDLIQSQKKKTAKKQTVLQKSVSNQTHPHLHHHQHQTKQQSIKTKPKSLQQTLPYKHMTGLTISQSQLQKLEKCAIIIQKYWRGYQSRIKLHNEINLAHYKIQMNKKKIADLDPKFWDDAKSNSIIRGQQQIQSQYHHHNQENTRQQQYDFEEQLPQLNSEIEKQISSQEQQQQQEQNIEQHQNDKEQSSSNNNIIKNKNKNTTKNKNKLNKNRIIQIQYNISQDILQKLNKLQQEMKQQRNKYLKLQEQNKDLKISLQKVSAQHSFQQSMQSSVKSNMSGWQEIKMMQKKQKYERDGDNQDGIQNNSSSSAFGHDFELRLPKKIQIKRQPQKQMKRTKKQLKKQRQKSYGNQQKQLHQQQQQERSISLSSSKQPYHKNINNNINNKNTLAQYKQKIQPTYNCTSPKQHNLNNNNNNNMISIDTALVQLFKKKQQHLKTNFQKKSNQFERLLKDSIYSPRTYNVKKSELELAFQRQTDVIRNKLEQATRAVSYAKEIGEMPLLLGSSSISSSMANDSNKNSINNRKQMVTTTTTVNNNINNNKFQVQQKQKQKQKQRQKIIHVVEDYGHIDLHSHRNQKEQQQQFIKNKNNNNVIWKNKSKQEQQQHQHQNQDQDQDQDYQDEDKDKKNIINNNNSNNNVKALQIMKEIQDYNKNSSQDYENDNENENNNDNQEEDQNNDKNLQKQKQDNISLNRQQQQQQQQSQQQQQPENQQQQQHSQHQNNNIHKHKHKNNNNNITINKGFQTTLLFIKDYCVNFFQFLRASPQHKPIFLSTLCTPIQYDTLQFLKTYRTTTQNQNQSSYNSQYKDYLYPYFKYLYPKSQVISRYAFMDFNPTYQKLMMNVNNSEGHNNNNNKNIIEDKSCSYPLQRDYFLNSLLDAYNQSFDYQRPCSYYGQPPPWIAQPKNLKNHPLSINNTSQEQMDKFLQSQRFQQACGSAIARVIQWSTSLCGFIPESPDIGDVVIDEQQINHIRQTRMALMLEKDLLQSEQKMMDSLIQQSEIKLQLGKVIMEQLLEQFILEIEIGIGINKGKGNYSIFSKK